MIIKMIRRLEATIYSSLLYCPKVISRAKA